MKNKIETAIHTHHYLTREKVTKTALADILFPQSGIDSARVNLNNLERGKTSLTIEQLKMLCEIFPHTNYKYWI